MKNKKRTVKEDREVEVSKEVADVYALKVHESLFIESGKGGWTEMLRVPGGWIYTQCFYDKDLVNSKYVSVFVPLSNQA